MEERLFVKDRSWLARLWCFRDALRGLVVLLSTQANARIHAAATLLVCVAGWWLSLSRNEWLFMVAAIGLVWVAEAFNTAIEFLVDLVSPEIHPLAGTVKDLAAGAVLAASVTAVVIGTLVLWPKLADLL